MKKYAVLLGSAHFLMGPFISYHETLKDVKKKIGKRDDFLILKADSGIKEIGKNGREYG